MARAVIDFKTDALKGVVEDLGHLDQEALVTLTVKSINSVAKQVHDASIKKVVDDINLSQQYVENALKLRLAEESQKVPTARVSAPIRNVTLSRFDAGQQSKPVTWDNARIESMGKKFSKWPGWTRRTGDKLRGIDADFKASGVDATVKRGRTKDLKSAFFLPLRNGGGRLGVFVHDAGRLKHLYGPAVYQLYRNYLSDNEDQIQGDLVDKFLVNLDLQIQKANL